MTAGGRLRSSGSSSVVAAPAAPAIDMLGLQSLDALLQGLGQRVVGLVHAGEQRVAAVGRDLDAVELRALADLGVPRRIGVPAAAAIVDRLVDLAVGLARADAHHRELGIIGMAGSSHAMRLHPAEAARIGEELGDGERLAAHHQHDAVEPGAVERVPVGSRSASAHRHRWRWRRCGDRACRSSWTKPSISREKRPGGTMHRIAALVFAALFAAFPAAGAGRLSQPADHPDRALRAGRRQRFPGPRAGRGPAGAARRDGGGAEPRAAQAAWSARCRSPRPSLTATRC